MCKNHPYRSDFFMIWNLFLSLVSFRTNSVTPIMRQTHLLSRDYISSFSFSRTTCTRLRRGVHLSGSSIDSPHVVLSSLCTLLLRSNISVKDAALSGKISPLRTTFRSDDEKYQPNCQRSPVRHVAVTFANCRTYPETRKGWQSDKRRQGERVEGKKRKAEKRERRARRRKERER